MDSIITFLLMLNQSPYKIIDELLSQIEELSKKAKVKPYDSRRPELKFIADGYPIYLLAGHEFAKKGMEFDVTQVIGLTNDDPVSTEYRWLKQIVERLNRTFKF